MNQAQMYVFHRLRGSGDEEAKELAGYSQGRTPPKARRLWKAACKIRHGVPEGALDSYSERIEKKRQEVREMEDILEASKVRAAISAQDLELAHGDEQGMA